MPSVSSGLPEGLEGLEAVKPIKVIDLDSGATIYVGDAFCFCRDRRDGFDLDEVQTIFALAMGLREGPIEMGGGASPVLLVEAIEVIRVPAPDSAA